MDVSCHRLFFLVLLLNQRWSTPLRLRVSHCSTFRIMCDVPSTAVFCNESNECFPVQLRIFSLSFSLLFEWLQLLLVLLLLLLLLLILYFYLTPFFVIRISVHRHFRPIRSFPYTLVLTWRHASSTSEADGKCLAAMPFTNTKPFLHHFKTNQHQRRFCDATTFSTVSFEYRRHSVHEPISKSVWSTSLL